MDIGGTFTDLLIVGRGAPALPRGQGAHHRSRPLGRVGCRGSRPLLEASGIAPEAVGGVIHGTTLVTNALIERRGARTALLTTAGFRDALEIGTEGRYDIYDLGLVKPAPLVERRLRFEVPERMNAAGAVLRALDRAALEPICDALQEEGIEAVAVCYLHAYANPAHEVATGEFLRERLPHLPVTLSHRVAPCPARVPARLHGGRQRLRAAARRRLPARARGRVAPRRRGRAGAHHAVHRRDRHGPDRRRRPHSPGGVGTGRRRAGRRLVGQAVPATTTCWRSTWAAPRPRRCSPSTASSR